MEAVMALIKELAEYEKAPDEVITNANLLRDDGFGDNPLFKCLVAEVNEEIVGIALYYPKYSTWKGRCLYLEDLVVRESARRMGIGKMLFDRLVSEARDFGAQRLEWQVLDWNGPAIKFYEKINANLDDEWINCKLTSEQIKTF